MANYSLIINAKKEDIKELTGKLTDALKDISDMVTILPRSEIIEYSPDQRPYIEVKKDDNEIFQVGSKFLVRTTPAFYTTYISSVIRAIKKDMHGS